MKHSTLRNELGFSDRDILRLSTPGDRHEIDVDSIPTFVLGTIINSIDSTYSNTPVFNLKNLDNEGLLDLNPQSAAQDDVSILMASNKSAACSSEKWSADMKAAANFGGVFGASAASQYDQSQSLASSDGNVYVSMQRGKHGSYFEINTKDLEAGYDFTPYLIGKALDEGGIKKYVSYKLKRFRDKKYIHEVIYGGYEGSGLIDWGERNIYGNIQLLTEMEHVFSMLLDQYREFKKHEDVRRTLYANMLKLKMKIGDAVRDFYAHVGTHFVSKLNFSNYAYGYGTLKFTERSGNEESRWGVAASLGGGIPSEFALDAGGSVSHARKSGWASAMKDLAIDAQTRPADIVDIGKFATDIMNMLNAGGKPLSVPDLGVPATPKVEVLDVPDVKKKKVGPPDSVFASYAEWKEYQEDKKKDKEGKDKVKGTIVNENNIVDEKLLDALFDDESDNADAAGTGNETNLYEAYMQEMESLRGRTKHPGGGNPAVGGNILRIENMFVSGFETTDYEAVIPSLRTSKILLPDEDEQIKTYPNATKLLLVINLFRQLADYMKFMKNFSISNISDDFARAVDDFAGEFSRKGYDLVTPQMSRGKDIDPRVLSGFARSMYDGTSSLLYKTLSDEDRFNYVKYLLKPDVAYLWRQAPGGYAPFFFEKDRSLRFAALKSIMDLPAKHEEYIHCSYHRYEILFDLSRQVTDTPDDIAQLYKDRTESPLYPVFRYELKNVPKFLFLQLDGRYQLVYGRNGMIHPNYWDGCYRYLNVEPVDLVKDTISHPVKDPGTGHQGKYVDVIPDMNEDAINELIPKMEGFDVDRIDKDYALYFPDKTQTRELREANRVIRMNGYNADRNIQCKSGPEQPDRFPDGVQSNFLSMYVFTNLYNALIEQFTARSGYLVKVDDGSKKLLGASEKFPVLLPIGYSKITGGYGSLLMGSSFGADNLIGSPTYDAAVITSMHD